MPYSYRIWFVTLAVAVVTIPSTADVRAEEFVSEKHGFRFRVPDGFHERADDTPMTLKMYAETEESAHNYLITIHVQALGQTIDPAQRLDPDQLPKKDGLVLTPEIRKWNELELQAVRQDISVSRDMEFVGYLIQFPLDEAIQIRVQGPKSRDQDVRNVFDKSVQSFVATRPYVVSIERVTPGKATSAVMHLLSTILPPILLVGLVAYFVFRMRKSQASR